MTWLNEIKKPFEKKEVLDRLDPLVKEWFFSKFKEFSLPQQYGVLPINNRQNILISAPTGGTKTLTAFLSILNYLVMLSKKQELEDKIYAAYISPLKALNNDIHINLETPLKEIQELAKKKKIKMQTIRVAVRTGDTPAKDKQKMLKKAPHILITTPESLGIVLSSKNFSNHLKRVEFLIIDEIHALANNKRGTHLSLSIERLEEMSIISPVRIGLSATIAPIEEIASYLVGFEKQSNNRFKERECLLCNIQFLKKKDLKVLCPIPNLIDTSPEEISNSLYNLLDKMIQENKTTLIFTNTRSATERIVHHLKERFPKNYTENIGAHHSSLSKKHRFNIEERLRQGKLKVVVCSTSLELGIDIGYIGLVILLSSPKSVARALQRIGRAGHKLHEVSKGKLIALDRDDLVECAILAKEAKLNHIDKVNIPKNCLDVLSQHIYGMAIYKIWHIDKLFDTIKKSYCYNKLSKKEFLDVISYLTGEYEGLETKSVYAKIWYNPETKEIGKRGRLARVIYMTNIGTIPDESFVQVVIAFPRERKNEVVGKIDEGFLERLKKNDVFVLGGSKYEFLYSRGMKIYVNASVRKKVTIPSWFSETLPLSFDLAIAIQKFRKNIDDLFKNTNSKEKIMKFIRESFDCDKNSEKAIYEYFYYQYKYSKISHLNKIVLEHFKDMNEKHYIFIHSLFGRRVNDALSRSLAYIAAITNRKGRQDIEVGINDNGFYMASRDKLNIKKAIEQLTNEDLEEILGEAIDKTEVFKRRFRHCATRSLMILRNYKGKKTVGKQQFKSGFLLGAVKKISKDFPILKETKREIMEDLMDIHNTKKVLEWVKDKKIKIEEIHHKIPSPFAFNLYSQGYSDFLKMEEKIEFLKRMHKKIKEKIKNKKN